MTSGTWNPNIRNLQSRPRFNPKVVPRWETGGATLLINGPACSDRHELPQIEPKRMPKKCRAFLQASEGEGAQEQMPISITDPGTSLTETVPTDTCNGSYRGQANLWLTRIKYIDYGRIRRMESQRGDPQ